MNSSILGSPIQGNFNSYKNTSSPGLFNGTKEFLNSNSLVAKFAFLLLVLIVFIFLLRMGISVLGYIFSPSSSPILLKGMIDASNTPKIIPQNPSDNTAIPILRSVNQQDGIEFTWSVWINIKDIRPHDHYKHIFHKGNNNIIYGTPGKSSHDSNAGLNSPNNGPGLYIAPKTNNLVVIMNTFNDINEQIVIKDIPLNKWVNVIIRVENTSVDVYINGTIVKRHVLDGVPKQNYGDVNVTINGGFNGYLSNLRYWNEAIGLAYMQYIVNQGPNLTMDDNTMLESDPRYFSMRWFMNNDNNSNADYGGL